MPEPIQEANEETWLAFLNQFEQEIYPHIFAPRGYTKAEALIIWEINKVENCIEELRQSLHPFGEDQ